MSGQGRPARVFVTVVKAVAVVMATAPVVVLIGEDSVVLVAALLTLAALVLCGAADVPDPGIGVGAATRARFGAGRERLGDPGERGLLLPEHPGPCCTSG